MDYRKMIEAFLTPLYINNNNTDENIIDNCTIHWISPLSIPKETKKKICFKIGLKKRRKRKQQGIERLSFTYVHERPSSARVDGVGFNIAVRFSAIETKQSNKTAQGGVKILETRQQLQERGTLARIGYPAASHNGKTETWNGKSSQRVRFHSE